MKLKLIIALTIMSIGYSEPYRGGELRTDQSFQYGRFETRMKAAPGSGVVNSFFLFRDYGTEGLNGTEHWLSLIHISEPTRRS